MQIKIIAKPLISASLINMQYWLLCQGQEVAGTDGCHRQCHAGGKPFISYEISGQGHLRLPTSIWPYLHIGVKTCRKEPVEPYLQLDLPDEFFPAGA